MNYLFNSSTIHECSIIHINIYVHFLPTSTGGSKTRCNIHLILLYIIYICMHAKFVVIF